MERKLIKQGGGGYTIYLPKKWIQRKGLQQKGIVHVVEHEGALVIGDASRGKKATTIEITPENRKILHRLLTYLYRRGFDEIRFQGVDEKAITEIQNVTKEFLLGFEVTHKTNGSCNLENISEPTHEKYDILVRRIFLILQEMFSLIARDAEEGKWKYTEEIAELRSQVDRFSLFCRRAISKERYGHDHVLHWELLNIFSLTAHPIDYLAKYCTQQKLRLSPLGRALLHDLIIQFDLLYHAYYNKDMKMLYKLNGYRESHLFGKCIEYLESSKGKESVAASYIHELTRFLQIGMNPVLSELLEALPRTDVEH